MASIFLGGPAQADGPTASVKQLMTKSLAGVAGQEVVVSTVTYPPGGPKVTLKPGETFYESPSDVHTVSANAIQTVPATFLVFIIKNTGAPPTRAAPP